MKKKWIITIMICFVVGMMLNACGSNNNNSSGSNGDNNRNNKSGDKTYKLDFSTQSVPEDVHTKGLDKFKEKVEELTDGQIEVKIHDSGSLFSQSQERQAVQRGDLDMIYGDPWSLSDMMPELSMFTAGYLFDDDKQMLDFYNSEDGEELFDKVADETGIRPLGAYFKGNRELNYRDIGKEIKTPDDLDGVILRMPDSKSWQELGKALGAKPTPMDYGELYTALESGTLDAQDNPLVSDKSAKFYEVTKYVTLTDHIVDNVWPAINEDLWKEMDSDLQDKMIEAIDYAGDWVSETSAEQEDELVQFMKDQGLTVVEADKDAFKKHVQDYYLNNEELTKDWDMDLYKKIQDEGE